MTTTQTPAEYITTACTPRGPLSFLVAEGLMATAIHADERAQRIASGTPDRTPTTLLDMADIAPHVFIPASHSEFRNGRSILHSGWYTDGTRR